MAICTICSKKAVHKETCPNCNKAPYCSLECRQTDAPIHEMLCASTKDFLNPPNNETSLIRAIIFSSFATQPRFIWLNSDPKADPLKSERLLHHITDLLSDYPDECPNMRTELIWRNDMRDVDLLDQKIIMFSREDDGDAISVNKAIRTVVDECKKSDVSSEFIRKWKAAEKEKNRKAMAKLEDSTNKGTEEEMPDNDNKLTRKRKRSEESKESKMPKPKFPRGDVIFVALDRQNRYRSLLHRDFRHIVDYLRLYCKPYSGLATSIQVRSRLVKGIRINCDGDVKKLELPRYQVVYFPQDHPIFQRDSADPYAIPQVLGSMSEFKVMGLPKVKHQKQWYRENPEIEWMLMHLQPGSETWGSVDRSWKVPRGSVHVVRADREDLSILIVKSLLEWVKERGEPTIGSFHESSPAEQQSFLEELKKDWLKAFKCKALNMGTRLKLERKTAGAVAEDATSQTTEGGQNSEGHEDVDAAHDSDLTDSSCLTDSEEVPSEERDLSSEREEGSTEDEDSTEIDRSSEPEEVASEGDMSTEAEVPKDTDMSSEPDNVTDRFPTPDQIPEDIDMPVTSLSDHVSNMDVDDYSHVNEPSKFDKMMQEIRELEEEDARGLEEEGF